MEGREREKIWKEERGRRCNAMLVRSLGRWVICLRARVPAGFSSGEESRSGGESSSG